MKRTAIITLLILGLAVPGLAQSRPVSFSLKGGVDYANLNIEGTGVDDPDYLLGFGGGITLSTHMQSGLSFDMDVLYMRKGAQQTYSSLTGHDVDIKTQLNYVTVSPMFRIAPGHSGAGIYFLGGGEVGYLLEAKSTSSGGDDDADAETDISDNFKELDYGVTFGLGFLMGSGGGGGFFVESRYVLGLNDLVDEEYAKSLEKAPTIKTVGIYVLGGIRF